MNIEIGCRPVWARGPRLCGDRRGKYARKALSRKAGFEYGGCTHESWFAVQRGWRPIRSLAPSLLAYTSRECDRRCVAWEFCACWREKARSNMAEMHDNYDTGPLVGGIGEALFFRVTCQSSSSPGLKPMLAAPVYTLSWVRSLNGLAN